MSFHQFNPFSGRLKESTHFQPLYPLSPKPLQKSDPPLMIFDSIKTKPATMGIQETVKGMKFAPMDPKIVALQKKYQRDLTIPTYRLAGRRDKLLYAFTVAMVAGGFISNMYVLLTGKQSN